jgi:predicted Zn-dependent protease
LGKNFPPRQRGNFLIAYYSPLFDNSFVRMLFAFCCLLFAVCTSAHSATEIRDTEIEVGLSALIAPIASAAGIADGRVRIHIIADDDFNAFVTNGEDVFLYTGLLTRIKSASALQAVVAHEMGHMIGGHMAQMTARMQAEMTRALIMQALGIGLMVANPMAGAGVMMGSSGIAKQSIMAFTRDEERLADDAAINLLAKADLDPNGLVEVLEQMREISGAAESRINPNNTNHPLTTERLKNVREKLKNLTNKPAPRASRAPLPAFAGRFGGHCRKGGGETPRYDLLRAQLVGYLPSGAEVKNLYPSGDKSDPAIYSRAIRFMRSGNLNSARVGTGTLISRNPNNPYFYELLGDIEYQSGNYDDSVRAYEKSLEKFAPPTAANAAEPPLSGEGKSPQIETALALVLTERNKPGDNERAIELAKRTILTEPTPLSYWVLVRAYGDDARADWARAEYYAMIKKESEAKKYATAARKKLPKNSPEYIKSGDLIKSF